MPMLELISGVYPERKYVFVMDGSMVLRWAASAFLATEKSFRRIQVCKDLWILETKLDEMVVDTGKKAA